MARNLIVFLTLLGVISAGIFYAVQSDPEYNSLRLFEQTLQKFSQGSNELEAQFTQKGALIPSSSEFIVNFVADSGNILPITVTKIVNERIVTLVLADGDWPLSNQTIVLEPFIKESQLRWKCIEGSVLVRNRNKNCRLGYGIVTSELR